LRAARLLASLQCECPILGVNFGNMGFLANDSERGVIPLVAAALVGELREERRANLRVSVVCEGDEGAEDAEGVTGGALAGTDAEAGASDTFDNLFALNEVVVRGANGRILDLSLDISDNHIADMRGDGMIVASATGSTAYSLSAGGPLVAPGFAGLIAVPLAPHTLLSRAIMTSENDVVRIDVKEGAHDAGGAVFIDGDKLACARPVRSIYVARGSVPTKLLRTTDGAFYERVSREFFE
jgi:NAD+ kinase